jgi:hypothetical protein
MPFGEAHFRKTSKGSRGQDAWKTALIAATLSASAYGSNFKMNRAQSVIDILGLRARRLDLLHMRPSSARLGRASTAPIRERPR